jgi:hypothetical protein
MLVLILTLACAPSPPAAEPQPAGAAIEPMDACATDADCVLVREDSCCSPSACDEDLRAETPARTDWRHRGCARKDCYDPPPAVCTAADARKVAKCDHGVCVVATP